MYLSVFTFRTKIEGCKKISQLVKMALDNLINQQAKLNYEILCDL
jgi:hypothetical protein